MMLTEVRAAGLGRAEEQLPRMQPWRKEGREKKKRSKQRIYENLY